VETDGKAKEVCGRAWGNLVHGDSDLGDNPFGAVDTAAGLKQRAWTSAWLGFLVRGSGLLNIPGGE